MCEYCGEYVIEMRRFIDGEWKRLSPETKQLWVKPGMASYSLLGFEAGDKSRGRRQVPRQATSPEAGDKSRGRRQVPRPPTSPEAADKSRGQWTDLNVGDAAKFRAIGLATKDWG
ncbi:hypothetical protein FN846DRAFT_895562 [Sphaerosporella brunnea]|uniref:Uncharacterized protein n=1 Tax=Sphaerosporella brunnea TaxID=1250544 RepID=A0A5J5EFQ5_9PEZI|nr:hypothetical protein FN846DRAFT_895562 [Sphaerosporella brunnea]